jgi:DNA helicase HerA-like ATPase
MTDSSAGLFVGKGATAQHLLFRLSNRHGLIAGATGTGKTVSVKVLAEGFSRAGVPVFMADVKGDLAGISRPGTSDARLESRAAALGLSDYRFEGCPAIFWDVSGKEGHPIRTTVSEMGPLLFARLLALSPAQEGVLNIAFKLADTDGLLLLDLKDLRAVLDFLGQNTSSLSGEYGHVSKASLGAIQRALLVLEQEGGEGLFGEPALDLQDLIRRDAEGRGYISVLAATELMQRPRLYATLLLSLLSELFEELPEVGDLDRPKLVFFFDEAHLLFDGAPKVLIDKVEQVVRLIRSKGIGIYFVSQSPLDIPETVLGQLGNRIQHALRAFTPRDQKAVRAAADTFRSNPTLDVRAAIGELAVGEALVSLLDERGVPGIVERVQVRPPCSRLGPISTTEREAALSQSPIAGRYEEAIDRDSAYEQLRSRGRRGQERRLETPTRRSREGLTEALAKSAARSIGSAIGRQIVRGLLGAILRRG